MRVVQINCIYPGGSTGKIVSDINTCLCDKGFQSFVIYGIGDKNYTENNIIKIVPEIIRKMQSLRARVTGYPYGGCIIGTYKIIKLLGKITPDVVHLHCINGYMVNIYKVLNYLKRNNIPTVLTLHAEFMYTSGCSYAVECMKWISGCHDCERIGLEHPQSIFFDRTSKEWKKMCDAFENFERLIICPVSDWVKERANLSPFFKGNIMETVLNGVNTELFHFNKKLKVIQKLNVSTDCKIIIHVTPDFYGVMKGGTHVLEMAKRFENENVIFLIIGVKGKQNFSLKNVHTIEHTSSQKELAEYYSIADVCLLTSVRETFSMVCAESLCCGTPVAGFKAGAPETISIPEYSSFVEQGNDNELEIVLRNFLSVNWDKEKISKEACELYARTKMCEKYIKQYEKAMNLD